MATECTMPPMTFLRMLRQLAIIEGISTLVLFGIAMPLKYFAGMPLAVTIVGIPLAIANLKIIPVTLAPLGKRIVPSDAVFARW